MIINDFSNYKHKTITDMVGTELTRNKLYFENENDNNIKPSTLLEMYIFFFITIKIVYVKEIIIN